MQFCLNTIVLLNLYMDISPLQVLQELEYFSKTPNMMKLLIIMLISMFDMQY